MYKRLSAIVTIIMILVLIVTGCTSQASNIGLARENDQKNSIGTDFVVAEVGSYDSADTAVVLSVDLDTGYVTFMNIATGKQYTLSYDGTTYVKDKYEGPMTMSQIRAGNIVDITFLKSKKKLASVQISPRAWVYDNVENYDLGGINKTATIGSATYFLPDQVVVLSEGQRTEIMDVIDKDVLTVSGIDHEIYSISIEKGHGYLRLSNSQALVGGWIEVGNAVIQQITENMLLAVPEGSYQVLLTNGGASCVKDVVIERDKEVILDVGDLDIVQDKTGKILFSVEPSTATVSVDGEVVDISREVELSYGIHRVSLKAEGYETLTKYIQVGSEYASLSFTMEEAAEEDSVSGNDSSNDVEDAVTGNKVYIDAPYDVEVYLDGNYVGISPVSFTKVTGSHTITLSKDGYLSKSYTIYLYDDGQDITYSFTDLEPEYDTVSGNSSITSGKSTSSKATSSSVTSSSSASTSSTTKETTGKIIINSPVGVEVYFDNVYKGVSPVSFTKVSGKHTITLCKDGYQSVNRTVELTEDSEDNIYNFIDLKEDKSSDTEPGDLPGTSSSGSTGTSSSSSTGVTSSDATGTTSSSSTGTTSSSSTGVTSSSSTGTTSSDATGTTSNDTTETPSNGSADNENKDDSEQDGDKGNDEVTEGGDNTPSGTSEDTKVTNSNSIITGAKNE